MNPGRVGLGRRPLQGPKPTIGGGAARMDELGWVWLEWARSGLCGSSRAQ